MAISEDLKRIYASAPDDDYHIETLSLEHSGLTSAVRYITNESGGFSGQLEDATPVTFEYLPFAVVKPRAGEENNLSLQVAVDNVSAELMAELEAIADDPIEPIICHYRVYLASDPNTVQNIPPLRLDIPRVKATWSTIAFVAGLLNLRGVKFPAMLFDIEKYPGLAR